MSNSFKYKLEEDTKYTFIQFLWEIKSQNLCDSVLLFSLQSFINIKLYHLGSAIVHRNLSAVLPVKRMHIGLKLFTAERQAVNLTRPDSDGAIIYSTSDTTFFLFSSIRDFTR